MRLQGPPQHRTGGEGTISIPRGTEVNNIFLCLPPHVTKGWRVGYLFLWSLQIIITAFIHLSLPHSHYTERSFYNETEEKHIWGLRFGHQLQIWAVKRSQWRNNGEVAPQSRLWDFMLRKEVKMGEGRVRKQDFLPTASPYSWSSLSRILGSSPVQGTRVHLA